MWNRLPGAWRNGLFASFIGGLLAYGAALAWRYLDGFDLVDLVRDGFNDDAFYYFQIASNLAEGKFSTFDGGITQTNGYHPLWMLVITPLYWVFDREQALFAIKAFEIMLVAGGVALVATAARLARLPWILLFAVLPALYELRILYRGLETALALFLLGLLFLASMLHARDPERYTWPLVAVAFVLPWVRLEYIAISLAATGASCVARWSLRNETPGASWRDRLFSTLPKRHLFPILGAVSGILAYFLYNRLVFGGFTPVSGAIKQLWSENWWEQRGGYDFVQNLQGVLQIPAFGQELLLALEVSAWFALVWWSARRSRSREDWLLLAFLVCVFSLAAGHLAKFVQTVFTVTPYWGRYTWYFVPAYLMTALIVPVRCYVAFHFVRRVVGSRSQLATRILAVAIVAVGATVLWREANFSRPFRHVDAASESIAARGWLMNGYVGTLVMNRVLPDDSVIGSWDAGATAYFSRFPVVNLDGLANGYEYLREYAAKYSRRTGIGPEYVQALHERFGITHYANTWTDGPEVHDGTIYERAGADTQSFRIRSVEQAPDSDAVSWFWERMEPHSAGGSEDILLVFDGRLVQAFARSCGPEVGIAWSWAGQESGPLVRPWTKTRTGLCTDVLVLPREASSDTVSAENAAVTPPEPLTAAFEGMPAEHDGESAFRFRVAFSEDITISYRTLRDESFTVTGGTVTAARRSAGRDDLWEITVEPDSGEAVTITLPGRRTCGASGAVCTGGAAAKQLANSPSATVAAGSPVEGGTTGSRTIRGSGSPVDSGAAPARSRRSTAMIAEDSILGGTAKARTPGPVVRTDSSERLRLTLRAGAPPA